MHMLLQSKEDCRWWKNCVQISDLIDTKVNSIYRIMDVNMVIQEQVETDRYPTEISEYY